MIFLQIKVFENWVATIVRDHLSNPNTFHCSGCTNIKLHKKGKWLIFLLCYVTFCPFYTQEFEWQFSVIFSISRIATLSSADSEEKLLTNFNWNGFFFVKKNAFHHIVIWVSFLYAFVEFSFIQKNISKVFIKRNYLFFHHKYQRWHLSKILGKLYMNRRTINYF